MIMLCIVFLEAFLINSSTFYYCCCCCYCDWLRWIRRLTFDPFRGRPGARARVVHKKPKQNENRIKRERNTFVQSQAIFIVAFLLPLPIWNFHSGDSFGCGTQLHRRVMADRSLSAAGDGGATFDFIIQNDESMSF